MTLIGLRSVEKIYGGRTILRGLDMKVNAGARIGLVGTNGAGKSTVLRILAGMEEVDGGEVVRRRGLSVASLPQYVEGDGRTPLEVVIAARPEISELQAELEACGEQLGSPEVASDLRRMQRVLERQELLLRRFTELGGPGFEGEARGYLRSLGIGDGDIERPMGDLSGGQRKLAVLASCLAAASRRLAPRRARSPPRRRAQGTARGHHARVRRRRRRSLPRPLSARRDGRADSRAGRR